MTNQAREWTVVASVDRDEPDLQEIHTAYGPALVYPDLAGRVSVGDRVLINRTARLMGLGTGGVDFVIARYSPEPTDEESLTRDLGHIVKLRYTPSQLRVKALEEVEENAWVWDRALENFPVIVAELHSQIPAPCVAFARKRLRIVYIMTDSASLACSFSRLVRELKALKLLAATITCGQAFGGDHETVSLHSALLAAKHLIKADGAIVCQGPGNAGTGTKYGFGGIEQAANLDIVAALNGLPILLARASDSDPRERHKGLSHHTRTVLDLVRSKCTIPLPAGIIDADIPTRHATVSVDGTEEILSLMNESGMRVTTMGRSPQEDPTYFKMSAAAGIYAAENIVLL